MMKQEFLADGIKQGIEQGACDKAFETVKKLIKMNLTINQIVEATGLTISEITSISN